MSEQNASHDNEAVNVVVEDSQEPTVTVETTANGGDTPNNDAGSSANTGGEQTERASQIISKLGEEKKAAYSQLVTLARSSDTAKEQVRGMLNSDPQLQSYVKSKFGADYDFIVSDAKAAPDNSIDLEKIKEEERVKVRAELIQEQLKSNRDQLVAQKAKQLGLNTDEFDKFQKYFETLSVTDGEETALDKAALLVNSDKATAQRVSANVQFGGGGEAEAPKAREVRISPAMKFAIEHGMGQNLNEFAKGMDRVLRASVVEDGEKLTVLQGI